MAAIGWVVDDGCAPKRKAGGAMAFAAELADAPAAPEGHRAACATCKLLGDDLACVGLVTSPFGAAAEEWLAGRLPAGLDSLPGLLLRKNLDEGGVKGDGTATLRRDKFFEAPGPFTRHYGPFFRRYTVTTDQIFEELLLAGDVQPAHALGVLVHLGGIAVDGKVLEVADEGAKLAELIEKIPARRERTLCTIEVSPADDPSRTAVKRYLRAAYAAFVLDCEIRVSGPV